MTKDKRMMQKRLYFKAADESEVIALPAGYPLANYQTLFKGIEWARCSLQTYRRINRRIRNIRKPQSQSNA
jgi:hypothetical protein